MIAKKIAELRILKGWTQEDLAAKSGIPRGVISRYEISSIPSIKNMEKLTTTFGVTRNYFYQKKSSDKIEEEYDLLPPTIKRKLRKVLGFDPAYQRIIISMIDALDEKGTRSKA